MQKITIKQYWDGFVLPPSTDYAEKYQIYCFSDFDACLYIGQAVNMNRRLRQHLGRIDHPYFLGESMVGHYIRASLPRSLSWEIQLLNNLDLFEFTTKCVDEQYKEWGQKWWKHNVNFASLTEPVLIQINCPVFNKHYNRRKDRQHPMASTYYEIASKHFFATWHHPERKRRKRKWDSLLDIGVKSMSSKG